MAQQGSPVLIVDDEWSMIQVMTAILSKTGHENVDTASDGATALRMLRQRPYMR